MCLVYRLLEAGELVLDACTRTLLAVNAYFQLRQHHRVVGCERHSVCFQKRLLSLLNVYAQQIYSSSSDTTKNEEPVKERKFF